jgi:hypothetical protein
MQSQVRVNRICGHVIYRNPAEVFLGLGFAACFGKISKKQKVAAVWDSMHLSSCTSPCQSVLPVGH